MDTFDQDSADDGDGAATLSVADAQRIVLETDARVTRLTDINPPWLVFVAAAVLGGSFLVIWGSVRNQHPYTGPSLASLGVLYGSITVFSLISVYVFQRASHGLRSASLQRRASYRRGFVAVALADYTFQGALYHAGASHAIVYGIYPACAPWLFAGSVITTFGVVREQRQFLGLGAACVVVGVTGSFCPAPVAWLVSGAGLVIGCVGYGSFIIHRRAQRQRLDAAN